jgi:diguanylate cyclase (GGDEF)-like protein
VLSAAYINGLFAAVIGLLVSVVLWRNTVNNIELRRYIEKQKEENEYLATHDSLTGLLNRNQFINFAEKEIARMKRTKKAACLIILDIDHFKKINDSHGHPIGDYVLKETSKLILGKVRQLDIVARFGGDEIFIFMPETDLHDGKIKAETLRTAVESHNFSLIDGIESVTISMGIVAIDPNNEDSLNLGYIKADSLLYKAKANGRNRVEAYEEAG